MPWNVNTLPQGAKQIGETTAAELILGSVESIESVDYLEAPLGVFRTKQYDGSRFDVVIDHDALDGEQLLEFLNVAAPYEGRQTLRGVIGDWNVVDRAQVDGQLGASELVELHKHLGSPWIEFMKSRRGFLATLEDARNPLDRYIPSGTPSLLSLEDVQNKSANEILARHARSIEEIAESLKKLGLEDADTLVIDAVTQEVNKKRHPNRQLSREEAIKRRFQSWHPTRKFALFKRLLSEAGEVNRKSFIETARLSMFDFATFEDGEVYAYPKELLDKTLQEIYDQRVRTIEGSFQGEYISLRDPIGNVEQVLVPGSVKRVHAGPRISPLIAWERDNKGKRSFVFERKTEAAASINFRDGVLGVLAVAYFAPDVRKSGKVWPSRMPIRGSREQIIGAAQVPVLALMRQGQLLKSDFVEAVESIVT